MTPEETISKALRCALGTHGDPCDATKPCPAMQEFRDALAALEEMRKDTERLRAILNQAGELSTGWKYGNEGIHLLRINSLLSGNVNCGLDPESNEECVADAEDDADKKQVTSIPVTNGL